MRGRPAPETRVLADVVEAQWLAFTQHDRQHAVLARQRADGRLLPRRQAIDYKLRERAGFARHAQSRITGSGQRPGRAHDHLQHVTHRELAGLSQHDLADMLEDLVLTGAAPRTGVLAHVMKVPARLAMRI